MASYTLIASRDPFESRETEHLYDLASDLRRQGNEVTLFLVQNGVFAARRSRFSEAVAGLAKNGIQILADGFSLRERGISPGALSDGVRIGELDLVVDHLAEGRKVVWH